MGRSRELTRVLYSLLMAWVVASVAAGPRSAVRTQGWGCAAERGLMALQASRLTRLVQANRQLCFLYDPGNQSGYCRVVGAGGKGRTSGERAPRTPGVLNTSQALLQAGAEVARPAKMDQSPLRKLLSGRKRRGAGRLPRLPSLPGHGPTLPALGGLGRGRRMQSKHDSRLLRRLRDEFVSQGGGLKEYALAKWRGDNPCQWDGLTCRQLASSYLLKMDFSNSTLPVQALPTMIGNLTSLKELKISGDFGGFVRGFAWNNPRLERLAISSRGAFELPDMNNLPKIKTIDLKDLSYAGSFTDRLPRRANAVILRNVTLPRGGPNLDHLKGIERVDIIDTDIEEFTVNFQKHRFLMTIFLHDNRRMRSVRLKPGDHNNLSRLVITGSPLLARLPDLRPFSGMNTLEVSGANLGVVDLAMIPFKTLGLLYLTGNNIHSINGTAAGPITKSRITVDISNNRLTTLSDGLLRLPLHRLLFANNIIPAPYPQWSLALGPVEVVDCSGNPGCGIENQQDLSVVMKSVFAWSWVQAVSDLVDAGFLGPRFARNIGALNLRKFDNPCVTLKNSNIDDNRMRLGCRRGSIVSKVEFQYTAQLPSLPSLERLKRVPTVTFLKIGGYKDMTALPDAIRDMKGLKVLHVEDTGMDVVPAWVVRDLPNLNALRLPRNKIHTVEELSSDEGARLGTELITIDVSNNALVRLPRSLVHFKGLSKLIFNDNVLLTEVDMEATDGGKAMMEVQGRNCGLQSVRIQRAVNNIDLSGNKISSSPDLNYDTLVKLVLERNQLTAWTITDMNRVKYISLKSNNLREFPKIDQMIHTLILADNQLTSLELKQTEAEKTMRETGNKGAHLRYLLDVSNNMLTSFIGPMHRDLILTNNKLTSVRILHSYADWSDADLSYNLLGEGPGLVGAMEELAIVRMHHNNLRSADINRLLGFKNLARIDVSDNLIESIDHSALVEWFDAPELIGSRQLELSRNKMANVFTAEAGKGLPRPKDGQHLGLDISAVTPEAMKNMAATILDVSLANATLQWEEGAPVQEDGGRECFELTNGLLRFLTLRRCECNKGFYEILRRGRPIGCRMCVPYAQCHGGRIYCSMGFYLDESGDEPRCVSCREMKGAECTDNKVVALPGYWKPTVESNSVYQCKGDGVCGGGANSTTNCRWGHSGSLCGECMPGYYKTSSALCQECPSRSVSVLYMVMMGTGCTVVLVILALPGMESARSTTKGDDFSVALDTVQGDAEAAATEASALVRLAVAFLQVLATFPSVYTVDFGGFFERVTEWFSWLDFDFLSASSLECVVEQYGVSSRSRYSFYHSMCLQAAIPILVVALSYCAVLAVAGLRRLLRPEAGVTVEHVKSLGSRLAFYFVIFVYLPVSTAGSQFFKCVSFDGGRTSYLEGDLTRRCYDEEWYTYLPVAATILALYSVGLPVLIVALLHPLSLDRLLAKAGLQSVANPVAYVGRSLRRMFPYYKNQYAWWESTELVRRLLVTSMAVHYSSAGQLQVAVGMTISFFALLVHMHCWPYVREELNFIQSAMLMMVYLNLAIGILKSLQMGDRQATLVTTSVLVMDVAVMGLTFSLMVRKVRKVLGKLGGANKKHGRSLV